MWRIKSLCFPFLANAFEVHQTGCSGSFSLGHCQRPKAYLLLCTAIIQVFVFPPGVSKRLVLHRPHALLLALIEDRSCHPVFSRLSGHPVRMNLMHVIPLCGPLKRETDRHRGNSKQVPTEREMFQNLTVSFLGKEGREGKERRWPGGSPVKQAKSLSWLWVWDSCHAMRAGDWREGMCACVHVCMEGERNDKNLQTSVKHSVFCPFTLNAEREPQRINSHESACSLYTALLKEMRKQLFQSTGHPTVLTDH